MYLQSNLKNLKSIYSLDWGSREARVESGSQTTRLHSKMISRAHGIHQASSVPVSPWPSHLNSKNVDIIRS